MTRLIDLSSRPSWLAGLPTEKQRALEGVVESHARALSEGLGAYILISSLVDELWAFALAIYREIAEREIGTSQEAQVAPMGWIPNSIPLTQAEIDEARAKYPERFGM